MADVLNNCFPALAHSSENSNEKIDAFNSDGNPFVLNARHICRIKDKFISELIIPYKISNCFLISRLANKPRINYNYYIKETRHVIK
jgi:hypothetical protein